MRIALTGTHSIGKTTLLNKLLYKFPLTPISEITREANREHGFKLNIAHNNEFKSDILQKYLINKHISLLDEGKNFETEIFIEDRCIIDALAYTFLFYKKNQISRSTLDYCAKGYDYINKYDLIIYLPLNSDIHKVVQDGYRDTNKQYQIDIDKYIKEMVSHYPMRVYKCINDDFSKRNAEVVNVINDFLTTQGII